LSGVLREWNESNQIEFSQDLLDIKDSKFQYKVTHRARTRSLQVNSLPVFPPLQCECGDCFELAEFICLVVPGSKFDIPTYVDYPVKSINEVIDEIINGVINEDERPEEGKMPGDVIFTCKEHISDLIGCFLNYSGIN
jgi:hypothetical protein